MTTLGDIGENEAIRRLARLLSVRADSTVGIGDDTAVVRPAGSSEDWLLTSDPVIEGVHFSPETASRRIGRKAAGRVLSDLAAMGGEPMWLLCDVTAPADMDIERLEEIYRGLEERAGAFRAAVIGGDMAEGKTLALHVFGMGRVPRGQAVLRSGGRPGDVLFVSGTLGGSAAGKHLDFEPRVNEGIWLREQGFARAMMDLSDGLALDLRRLLEASNCSADIQLDWLPLASAAREARDGRAPLEHALADGEDFELLFAVPPEKAGKLPAAWREHVTIPCTRIGRLAEGPPRLRGANAEEQALLDRAQAFEHFTDA